MELFDRDGGIWHHVSRVGCKVFQICARVTLAGKIAGVSRQVGNVSSSRHWKYECIVGIIAIPVRLLNINRCRNLCRRLCPEWPGTVEESCRLYPNRNPYSVRRLGKFLDPRLPMSEGMP